MSDSGQHLLANRRAIRYDRPQDLHPDRRRQARENAGADVAPLILEEDPVDGVTEAEQWQVAIVDDGSETPSYYINTAETGQPSVWKSYGGGNNGTPKARWESLATSDPLDAPTQEDIRNLLAVDGKETKALFNVRDYGAVGDGVTDDRAAIQSAITAAVINGGGVVYLPPGTYALQTVGDSDITLGFPAALVLGSNVTIEGQGWGTSILKIGDSAPAACAAIIAITPSAAPADIIKNISLINFEIDGNSGRASNPSKSSETVNFSGTQNVLIDRIYIHDCGDAIDIDDPFNVGHSHFLFNSRIENAGGVGFHTAGPMCWTDNTQFINCGRARLDGYNPSLPRETRWITPYESEAYPDWDGCCIDARRGNYHRITNTRVDGGGRGIKISIGQGTIVENCHITGPFLDGCGIMVGDSPFPDANNVTPRGVIIRDCTFSSLTDSGIGESERVKIVRAIWVRHGTGVTIDGCNFYDGGVILGGANNGNPAVDPGPVIRPVVQNCHFFAAVSSPVWGGNININNGTVNPIIRNNTQHYGGAPLIQIQYNPTRGEVSGNTMLGSSGRIADVRARGDGILYINNTSEAALRFMSIGNSPNRGIDSIGCVITGNLTSFDIGAAAVTDDASNGNIIKNNIVGGEWTPDGITNP